MRPNFQVQVSIFHTQIQRKLRQTYIYLLFSTTVTHAAAFDSVESIFPTNKGQKYTHL